MEKYYETFKNNEKITKTLSFSLVPVGKTGDWIKNNKVVEKDIDIAHKYQDAKQILDQYLRSITELILSENSARDLNINWIELFDKYRNVKTHRNDKEAFNEYYKSVGTIKEKIQNAFSGVSITSKDIIESAVKNGNCAGYPFTEDEIDILKAFVRFDGYFSKYNTSRNNIFKSGSSASIPYRCINDNFAKFGENILLFESLPPQVREKLKECCPVELFRPQSYDRYLCQAGVKEYNKAIGGYVNEDGSKIQGLNEILNECYQQKLLSKKRKFNMLFNQILSDKESLSFALEPFENDRDVLDAVSVVAGISMDYIKNRSDEIVELLEDESNHDDIYILDRNLNSFSSYLFSDFRYIRDQIKAKKGKPYTVGYIDECLPENIIDAFKTKYTGTVSEIISAYEPLNNILSRDSIEGYDEIKSFLDSVIALNQLLKTFSTTAKNKDGSVKENCEDRNVMFYSALDEMISVLSACTIIYNKVRNYATRKPYSTRKYKLNFDNGTLAAGWDITKEKDNSCIILNRGNEYYLGVYNKTFKGKLTCKAKQESGDYRKLYYKYLPSPMKMFPKVFFSGSWLKNHDCPLYIFRGYKEEKRYKPGENFDIDFLHDLIDYFKKCAKEYPNYEDFEFDFKETGDYNSLDEFYADVEKSNLFLKWDYVSNDEVNDLVDDGSLYLFRIYNKDFSGHSTGKPNNFTRYFLNLFTDENMVHPTFKLNGGGELFYRPKSIDNPFVHRKNSILFNKVTKEGKPLNGEMIELIYSKINGGAGIADLEMQYPDVKFKTARYDITKDKRYMEDKFEFHFSIDINSNAVTGKYNLNKEVVKKLSEDPNINIVGIDRGERNLLYMSVINQKGEILLQKSLNIINGIDYHAKLTQIENDRMRARKDWKTISKIADMQKGYLSWAINEIINTALEYNAIIILEDLNQGFNRFRRAISEKSVYTEFEKALISRLNYVAPKDKDVNNGYQLADMLDKVSDLSHINQTGIVFYVPAAFTSKIDPVTGFVNLFTKNEFDYRNRNSTLEFFRNFESIRYNEAEGYFEFSFKYSSFGLKQQDPQNDWTVCSTSGSRIVHTKVNGYDTKESLNVTEEFIQLFSDFGIDVKKEIVSQLDEIKDAEFFRKLLWLFKSLVQLRYEDDKEDYILSPIVRHGRCFDSREAKENEPIDGDANGAFHIALQGLRMFGRIDKETWKIKDEEQNKKRLNYLKYCQKELWKTR
ncbi:MAG: type V CRISPR-associated protein Cas12a/Cpf1 [Erysipelotrichaceae bacterium]|nr:type V CRISPR-associated protein Cas12a/Cpf1 [Erysipelotrichaceae bacterium]